MSKLSASGGSNPRVAIVTLGCSRNEVDSEELAGRLAAGGWELVDDASAADVAVINTCGFIEAAKKDSIDAILEAHDLTDPESGAVTSKVVAVGCMAQRYGAELAAAMPEADAVLGFDSYQDMSASLRTILGGGTVSAPVPGDRRELLPSAPAARPGLPISLPGHGQNSQPLPPGGQLPTITPQAPAPENQSGSASPIAAAHVVRRRLNDQPWAPLKIASGCDRRCAFCAIPAFRGSFISRPSADVLSEAQWLADQGVREVLLVSENSTSYGKDLADIRALDKLLAQLSSVIDRVRLSYLQPAETRPELLDAMAAHALPYVDISFQHASGPLLRKMRRFGDHESFLKLLDEVRARMPEAGVRTNVILGFPGETEDDVQTLTEFLGHARLDITGVFGYSNEEGTEAYDLPGAISAQEISARVDHVRTITEEISHQRAAERIGQTGELLVESISGSTATGRIAQQGPEVDGQTTFTDADICAKLRIGDILQCVITDSHGIDLIASSK